MSSNFMRDKNDELLFSTYDLRSLIHQREKELIDEINTYEKNTIMKTNIDDLCNYFENKYKIQPIVLRKDKICVSKPIETEIDISQDWDRFIIDRSEPHYIRGISIAYIVPFEGDGRLLYCRASAYSLNPPTAVISGSEIIFTYVGENPDPEKIKTDFDHRMSELERHIQYVLNDIIPFNNSLQLKVRQRLQERRAKIVESEKVVGELGYPIRQEEMTLKSNKIDITQESKGANNLLSVKALSKVKSGINKKKKPSKYTKKTKKWHFFICHASEDKNTVAIPIHNKLTEHGYKVWLDKYELKLGDSLRKKIDEGLENSQYGIVILGPDFFAKKWPQNELDGLVTLELDGRKRILPIWHNVDFEDVKKYSPILASRLAARTSEGIEIVVDKIIDDYE